MGRMEGEGLVVRVPGRSRLESSDIGAVAKFGLSVAADDLVIIGFGKPLLLLLRCTLSFERNLECERTIQRVSSSKDIP